MSDPFSVDGYDKPPNAVKSSALDDRTSSASPSVSQHRGTLNFSRPLPLSPPGSPQSIALPANAVASSAQASISPRPLPSVPGLSHTHPQEAPEHVQGGRGSGLGTRIIDDRDPDDIVTPSHLVQSQSPNHSHDEDGASTMASDSELLYASAPSTPLRQPVELEWREIEEGDATIGPERHEGGQHGLPERRATVALAEIRHDQPEGTATPKRAATVDFYERRDQEPPVPTSEIHRTFPMSQHLGQGHALEDLGYDDDLDPYLRKIVERFSDEPKFPGPLFQGHSDSAPTFPEPQPHPYATALAFPVPEPHSPSPTRRDSETVTLSIPSAISFPIPSDQQYASYPSSTIHAVQASGGQITSSDAYRLPPSVIAGTDLQFEPFPSPYERTTLDDSRPAPGEAVAHAPGETTMPNRTLRPLPPFPVNIPSSTPGGLGGHTGAPHQDVDDTLNSVTAAGTNSNSGPNLAAGIAPTAPLRISKHIHTPPPSPGIPRGAAATTLPAPPSPGSPEKEWQSPSTKGSLPPIPSSPPPQEDNVSSPDGQTTIRTLPALESSSTGAGVASTKQETQAPTATHGVTRSNSTEPSTSPTMRAPVASSQKPLKSALKKKADVSVNSAPHAHDHSVTGVSATSTKAANIGHEKEKVNSSLGEEDGPVTSGKPAQLRKQIPGGVQARSHAQVPAQGSLSERPSHSEPQNQASKSQFQSQSQKSDHPPLQTPSQPPPPPPHSDVKSTVATPHPRHRASRADSLQHHRTPAEEKAEYNAIPPSSRSQYMKMLLALDDIPTVYNLFASFFTWILLAGFILFPGTFTSLQTLDLGNGVGAALVNRVVNLPLFVVAFVCTGIGIVGMGYLWWRWMKNYIWLVSKIFLPGLMNSLAGIISTLVNVYGVQDGEFNTTSIVTISVTGGVAVVCSLLSLWYGVWMLGRIKKRHKREMGIEKAGKHGEGVWAGFKEKVGKVGRRR